MQLKTNAKRPLRLKSETILEKKKVIFYHIAKINVIFCDKCNILSHYIHVSSSLSYLFPLTDDMKDCGRLKIFCFANKNINTKYYLIF